MAESWSRREEIQDPIANTNCSKTWRAGLWLPPAAVGRGSIDLGLDWIDPGAGKMGVFARSGRLGKVGKLLAFDRPAE
jgi:hypothetical protein